MKRYDVVISNDKLVREIDETARAQSMAPEDLIALLLHKAMAPWSKAAKNLEDYEEK